MDHPHASRTMIRKADGSVVPLDMRKLARSVRRVGASNSVVRDVARDVAPEIRSGMTTAQIHALVFRALRRRREHLTCTHYSLKEAMRRLGPAGYDFERYVAAVLRAHGYEAHLPALLPGMAVQQEVDVIARSGATTAMVEAKYRNHAGVYVHLKDVMATWARLQDLQASFRAGKHATRFTAAWIICNTKVTTDGVAFGEYNGMRIIGWEYPTGAGLEQMVITKHVYPVTVLRSLSLHERSVLAAAGLIVYHDIAGLTARALVQRTGIPQARAEQVLREVHTTLDAC